MNIFGLFNQQPQPQPQTVEFDDNYFAQDDEYIDLCNNRNDEDEDEFDLDLDDLLLDEFEQNNEDYSGLDDLFLDMENDD
ncbi:MAG: hypothetical protein ACOVOV_01285 [Dolichospermum sp.]